VLDALYNQVKKRSPDYAAAYTAAGQLALSKHDYALAAEEFATALKLDATDADIHYGIGAAFASSDSEKSAAAFQAALERNPNHVETLLYLADHAIDAESYQEAKTTARIEWPASTCSNRECGRTARCWLTCKRDRC